MTSFDLFGNHTGTKGKKADSRRNRHKSDDAYRTISEVADHLSVATHVLRFWETKFPQIKPVKRGGGRRYYRPEDVDLLKAIQTLLYDEGYTIKGVQNLIKKEGVKALRSGETVLAGGQALNQSQMLRELKSIRDMLNL